MCLFPDTFLLNQRLCPAAPSVAVFAYELLTGTPHASGLLQISAEEACFLRKLCGIHKERCFVGHPLQWNRMAFCCPLIECRSLEGQRKRERERKWNSDWTLSVRVLWEGEHYRRSGNLNCVWTFNLLNSMTNLTEVQYKLDPVCALRSRRLLCRSCRKTRMYSFFETLHCQPLDMADLPVSVKLSWNDASSEVNKSYG